MKPVAFVTSSLDPAITADDQLAAAELASRGVRVQPAIWDDEAVDWQSFAAIILRSPWDYHQKLDTFTAWLRRLHGEGRPVWNPAAVVLGNLNKRYLLHLEHRGVAIVPTEFVPRGRASSLGPLLDRRGWTDAVVKPAVSLGAAGAWRVSRQAASDSEARFLAEGQLADLLVQEACTEIETTGEWSLVFFGGRFSHAVLKRPAAGDFRVQFHFGGQAEPSVAPQSFVDQAASTLSFVPGRWLYARVDGIERDGQFVLMELEIAEPNLFFSCSREAPGAFADAVSAVLQPCQ